ncbi:uncharacterized protein PGTG_16997 [Puccinia graminis f. sp. tritici CRL 75-36-700-3]|uniref:CCHC-type domain-containing protein n=1 Tax=Puccinia graminis f. sp. tritici (strain CRL 75-36-700-3 / race SCCL) TaxID=418459 RepID=E3L468_PUCGT|nr:uncharacterized protein PGTG_16997 [Puccinia graminis f. sp. tritici CRL 75-36-700-3]EFP91343.1 hypothetical protein PGTG_16997 [Puccinia graminis f. sp. tritici CRL 75-36-700-3]
MPLRTLNNPSHLIRTIPTLDGNLVTFAAWCSWLLDVLSIMNVLDIVDKSLLRPSNTKESKSSGRSPDQKGYNPEDFGLDWDALSDLAWSTIKLTLSVDLTIRYGEVKPASKLFSTIVDAYEKNTRACWVQLEDNFWLARHDPNMPIAKWIARIRKAASDSNTAKIAPANQQVCDRLLQGLDNSWKTICDHLVYSPKEVSLDDAIGALEEHKLSTTAPMDHLGHKGKTLASVAKTKRMGCYNCGEKGHHLPRCSKPAKKNKSLTQANQVTTCAGATTAVPPGCYGSERQKSDDNNSFNNEIDVVWG